MHEKWRENMRRGPDAVAEDRRDDGQRAREKKNQRLEAHKQLALPHDGGVERAAGPAVEVCRRHDGQQGLGSAVAGWRRGRGEKKRERVTNDAVNGEGGGALHANCHYDRQRHDGNGGEEEAGANA